MMPVMRMLMSWPRGSVLKIPEQPVEMGFAQILPNSILLVPWVPIKLKSTLITYNEPYENIGKFQWGIRLAQVKSFLSKFCPKVA